MQYNRKKIEDKWNKLWLKSGIYEPDFSAQDGPLSVRQAGASGEKKFRPPFYNLMMFPYPSAEGLHIGAVRTFSGVDIYGRFKRMQGNDVFEPIGLDGFGIHSENYALKIGKHPIKHAKDSEKNFYRQLEMMGNGFSWDEKLETYDPDYYKWTQWIFVQMFKRGLAYRKKSPVNWCPSCLTVLADEQVISEECERCGTKVIKKELEQWFFKITDYAERLLKNLEKLDWSESVKIAQKNWIGKSEGLIFSSPVKDTKITLETFSAHFEAFTADTFLVIAPDHPVLPKLLEGTPDKEKVLNFCREIILERQAAGYEDKELKGIFTGCYTVDPVGNGNLPIWVANYALADYGTGIVKCSAHDERDFAFAKKYNIRLKATLLPSDPNLREDVLNLKICYSDMKNGILTEPAPFAGKVAGEVREKIIRYCMEKKLARPHTTYKLRDWLVSRQRYWGPPIPMIFCEHCKKENQGERNDMPGWFSVKEKDLPVKLPYVKNFRPTGTGTGPLGSVKSFYEVKCPRCGGAAHRETDVSDAFLDSAWYYIGYLMAFGNWKLGFGNSAFAKLTRQWLPVDMYIGGAEHSVLHLLYSRFLAMALRDLGLLNFEEPFTVFRAHGLITKDGAKMSKSKGNVVNPDEYFKVYGADTMRMYLAFMAPLYQSGDFRDEGIIGMTRFLNRVFSLISNFQFQISNKIPNTKNSIQKKIHQTVKKVTEDIENLEYNTAISALMILLNEFETNPSAVTADDIKIFLKLLAPFAPYMTEELYQQFFANSKLQILNDKKTRRISAFSTQSAFRSIHLEPWPEYDPKLIEEDAVTIIIQINGKVRGKFEAKRNLSENEVRKLVFGSEKIKSIVGDQAKIKKFIYVKDKLVNIVI